ncbi:DUF2490 domain-containing protein [Parabacteroides sp. OttesenSCG-928-K15]|nr:DUF2490 domain-containing protein [Parabacteroides sp. OttesenSCG-928-K15]
MRKQIILLLVLLCGGFAPFAAAQKKSDLSGWATADLVLNHKRWDITTSLEYRSKENIGATDLFSIGQYGRYTFSPLFKVSLGYELFFTHTDSRGTILEHRLMAQNESSLRIRNFRIDNRLSLLDDFEKINDPAMGFRDRIRVKYPVKRFEPFTYIELYYRFKPHTLLHHKNRYGAGVNYTVSSQSIFTLYYMCEQYFQKDFTNNVCGISYAYTLPI